jgi:hypothetical protein
MPYLGSLDSSDAIMASNDQAEKQISRLEKSFADGTHSRF